MDSEISAREGRFDQAAKILEDALQLFPERSREVAGRIGGSPLVSSDFLEDHPSSGYILLAQLAENAGEMVKASQYLKRIEELDPRGSG